MSERPTQTPASSATDRDRLRIEERRGDAGAQVPPAAGQSLAARAARFRSGAPFLVERATLYDPLPLGPAGPPASPPPHRGVPLLPAALTLLGVVIVVGLAAAILFVRNSDGPRFAGAPGRVERFAERVARPSEPSGRRDQVTYDLTRRPNDTIVGAWRPPKETEARHPAQAQKPPPPVAKPVEVTEDRLAAPPRAAEPAEPARTGLRRLLPRRLTAAPGKRTDSPAETAAAPATPPRAPLDDPSVRKATAEPESASPAAAQPPSANERPGGGNIVARVGRKTDPSEEPDRKVSPPRPPEGRRAVSVGDRVEARRSQRSQLRRMREARRQAEDTDRFLLHGRGDIPKGFVFSGPQSQRP
jgi:hypothetical protein